MNPRQVLLPSIVSVAALFPTTSLPTVHSGGTWTRPPVTAESARQGITAPRSVDRAIPVRAAAAASRVKQGPALVQVRPAAALRPTPIRRTAVAAARPTWEQRLGAEALQLISYPWRDLGWRVSFHPARRGVLGISDAVTKQIHVYVRRHHSARMIAFTVAHEIGHAYDFTRSTRESHNRWLELRGIDRAVPWFSCDGCNDLETPAGDFAEVFAVWQVGPVDFRSRMAPLPTGAEMDLLAQEFAA